MTRSAIVTGGSSGIGFAVARMLRREGFDVTLVSRTAEKLGRAAAEIGATAIAADVGDVDECARVVEEHRLRAGRLDVLVNSAGKGIGGAVDTMPLRHFDLQFSINVRGIFALTQAAVPLLRGSRGWIFNVASIAGTIPSPGLSVYGATKAAVISFTRSIGQELDWDGVRATAICPAFVATPMAEWTGVPEEELIQPDDVAAIVEMCLRLSPHARIPEVVIENTAGNNEILSRGDILGA